MSANELAISFVYAGQVYAAAIVLPMVAIGVIALRFFIRSKRAYIGADDWAILLALFPVIGMGICLVYGTSQGAIGYPSPPYPVPMDSPILEELYETTPEQTILFIMDWVIWILMIPGNGLIKLSALLMYRRIFVVNRNSAFDLVTKFMILICVLWTIAFEFAQIFGCGSNFGNPFGPLAEIAACNTNARLSALMISDLATDIIVWMLPMPVVWQLHMGISKKVSVTAILSLAAMSLAAAVVRLLVEEEISGGGYAAHTDVNLTLTILLYWSMIESGLALIAACLPTLQSLLTIKIINDSLTNIGHLLSRPFTRLSRTQASSKPTNRAAPDGESHLPSRRAKLEAYEMPPLPKHNSDAESGEEQLIGGTQLYVKH